MNSMMEKAIWQSIFISVNVSPAKYLNNQENHFTPVKNVQIILIRSKSHRTKMKLYSAQHVQFSRINANTIVYIYQIIIGGKIICQIKSIVVNNHLLIVSVETMWVIIYAYRGILDLCAMNVILSDRFGKRTMQGAEFIRVKTVRN